MELKPFTPSYFYDFSEERRQNIVQLFCTLTLVAKFKAFKFSQCKCRPGLIIPYNAIYIK